MTAWIDEACAAGARVTAACRVVAISPRTLQRWREAGEVKADGRQQAGQQQRQHQADRHRQREQRAVEQRVPERAVAGQDAKDALVDKAVTVRCIQRADGTMPDNENEPGLVAYYLSEPVIAAYQKRRKKKLHERFLVLREKLHRNLHKDGAE